MNLKLITLEGRYVRLEPLELLHHADLCEAGLTPEIWRWMPLGIENADDMRAFIETALQGQAEGTSLPFATIVKSQGRAAGSTRYANVDKLNRRLEIGWTWIEPRWQQTAVNTEAKYLLLQHAFEELGCLRVEFKTDSLNERSRKALSRIGATEEGTFRNHMVTPSGRIRHSVYFSIIDSEWPSIKAKLEQRLASKDELMARASSGPDGSGFPCG